MVAAHQVALSGLLCLQANNVNVKKSPHAAREEGGLLSHVDLVQLLDIVDLEAGTAVAGDDSSHACNICLYSMACLPACLARSHRLSVVTALTNDWGKIGS